MIFIFGLLALLLSSTAAALQREQQGERAARFSSPHAFNSSSLVGSVCSSSYDSDAAVPHPSVAGDESSLVVEYSAWWRVQIRGGMLVADSIAERHGFINNGLVNEASIISLQNYAKL